MDQATDHSGLNDLLQACGSDWSASQAHGLLCSRLSVGGSDGAARWFAQVLEQVESGHPQRGACEEQLDKLYSETWRQLVERQSELCLLLPDDSVPIVVRAAAMGLWCEGFLHGLVSEKHSEALKDRLANEPVSDIIKDMLQITRAMAGEDDEETDESAFAELAEYLRVAAQLIYEELADFRAPEEDPAQTAPDTLH